MVFCQAENRFPLSFFLFALSVFSLPLPREASFFATRRRKEQGLSSQMESRNEESFLLSGYSSAFKLFSHYSPLFFLVNALLSQNNKEIQVQLVLVGGSVAECVNAPQLVARVERNPGTGPRDPEFNPQHLPVLIWMCIALAYGRVSLLRDARDPRLAVVLR